MNRRKSITVRSVLPDEPWNYLHVGEKEIAGQYSGYIHDLMLPTLLRTDGIGREGTDKCLPTAEFGFHYYGGRDGYLRTL